MSDAIIFGMGLNVDGIKKGAGKVKAILDESLKPLGKMATSNFSQFFGAAGLANAIGSLKDLGMEAIKTSTNLMDLSQKANSSYMGFQVLANVASLSGSGPEQLSKAMVILASKTDEAASKTGDLRNAFLDLKLDPSALQGKDGAEQMTILATAFRNVGDSQKGIASIKTILGDNIGSDMLQTFNSMGDSIGAMSKGMQLFSEEQANAFKALQDNLEAAKRDAGVFIASVLGGLIKVGEKLGSVGKNAGKGSGWLDTMVYFGTKDESDKIRMQQRIVSAYEKANRDLKSVVKYRDEILKDTGVDILQQVGSRVDGKFNDEQVKFMLQSIELLEQAKSKNKEVSNAAESAKKTKENEAKAQEEIGKIMATQKDDLVKKYGSELEKANLIKKALLEQKAIMNDQTLELNKRLEATTKVKNLELELIDQKKKLQDTTDKKITAAITPEDKAKQDALEGKKRVDAYERMQLERGYIRRPNEDGYIGNTQFRQGTTEELQKARDEWAFKDRMQIVDTKIKLTQEQKLNATLDTQVDATKKQTTEITAMRQAIETLL